MNENDVMRQLKEIVKEGGISFEKVSKHDMDKDFKNKFVYLTRKTIEIGQYISFIVSKYSYLSDEKKKAFDYLDRFMAYENEKFTIRMNKIEKFNAKDSEVDIEDINGFIYDLDNFTEKTFQFINKYFYDGTLTDVWKF